MGVHALEGRMDLSVRLGGIGPPNVLLLNVGECLLEQSGIDRPVSNGRGDLIRTNVRSTRQ